MTINHSSIEVLSACNVNHLLLEDFYSQMYPERIKMLSKIWKWLNRIYFLEEQIPLVACYDGKIVGHAGMIPIKILMGGEEYYASWFMDFSVLPKFQNKGIGILLTNRWMELCDIHITFCNDKSMGVFKKFGWIESFNTYMNIHLINPFNHPRMVRLLPKFLRQLLNIMSKPVYFAIYRINSLKARSGIIARLADESREDLANFFSNDRNHYESIGMVCPLRDTDFQNWRIYDSPNFDKYLVYKKSNFISLLLPNDNHGKYIDILWISDITQKKVINEMISFLGLWGMKRGYAYIRFYTSDKSLSGSLKKSLLGFVLNPRFAYKSSNPELLAALKMATWNWQLIDSDFERF